MLLFSGNVHVNMLESNSQVLAFEPAGGCRSQGITRKNNLEREKKLMQRPMDTKRKTSLDALTDDNLFIRPRFHEDSEGVPMSVKNDRDLLLSPTRFLLWLERNRSH